MRNSELAMQQEFESSGFVHSVYDDSPYGILVFNAALEIVDWNPAVEKLIGLSKTDCMGNNILELFDNMMGLNNTQDNSDSIRGTLVVAEALSGKFLVGHVGHIKVATIVDKSGALNGGTLIITLNQPI